MRTDNSHLCEAYLRKADLTLPSLDDENYKEGKDLKVKHLMNWGKFYDEKREF